MPRTDSDIRGGPHLCGEMSLVDDAKMGIAAAVRDWRRRHMYTVCVYDIVYHTGFARTHSILTAQSRGATCLVDHCS